MNNRPVSISHRHSFTLSGVGRRSRDLFLLPIHRFRFLVAMLSILAPIIAWGQVAPKNERDSGQVDVGPVLADTETSYWKFGLKIHSQGQSSGIVATVPLPSDWPEQKVEQIGEVKSDNVRRLSQKALTASMQQLVIKINRLGDGETAEAATVFRIEKRMILSPDSPEKLKLAKRVPASIRTYLKPSPYIESNHPRIKSIAQEEIPFDSNLSDFENVEQIYRWVREHVQYEFDPVIHSCLDALDAEQGDCEELSSLFIAICRAKKIPARAVWIPSHTYPEFYMQDESGKGYWIPCQVAGSYSFGEMIESKPILQKGDRFRVPGSRKPLRYVQPMLTAKDSEGGLSIEWIMRPLEEDEIEAFAKD